MTEQQPYEIVQIFDAFEVRRYPAHVLAEVVIDGTFENAGNRAFRYLFGYISGENRSRTKVSMTAPVVQQHASTRIAMTAPVIQQSQGVPQGQDALPYRVAFVLPATFTLETAPQPTSPEVHLREVTASLVAAIRFGGRWTNASYRAHLGELTTALANSGFAAVGSPRFARFDPPYKPWFLRRNEVVMDVESASIPTGSPGPSTTR